MSSCSDMDGSNITGSDLSSVGPIERNSDSKKRLRKLPSKIVYVRYLAENGIDFDPKSYGLRRR